MMTKQTDSLDNISSDEITSNVSSVAPAISRLLLTLFGGAMTKRDGNRKMPLYFVGSRIINSIRTTLNFGTLGALSELEKLNGQDLNYKVKTEKSEKSTIPNSLKDWRDS